MDFFDRQVENASSFDGKEKKCISLFRHISHTHTCKDREKKNVNYERIELGDLYKEKKNKCQSFTKKKNLNSVIKSTSLTI